MGKNYYRDSIIKESNRLYEQRQERKDDIFFNPALFFDKKVVEISIRFNKSPNVICKDLSNMIEKIANSK